MGHFSKTSSRRYNSGLGRGGHIIIPCREDMNKMLEWMQNSNRTNASAGALVNNSESNGTTVNIPRSGRQTAIPRCPHEVSIFRNTTDDRWEIDINFGTIVAYVGDRAHQWFCAKQFSDPGNFPPIQIFSENGEYRLWLKTTWTFAGGIWEPAINSGIHDSLYVLEDTISDDPADFEDSIPQSPYEGSTAVTFFLIQETIEVEYGKGAKKLNKLGEEGEQDWCSDITLAIETPAGEPDMPPFTPVTSEPDPISFEWSLEITPGWVHLPADSGSNNQIPGFSQFPVMPVIGSTPLDAPIPGDLVVVPDDTNVVMMKVTLQSNVEELGNTSFSQYTGAPGTETGVDVLIANKDGDQLEHDHAGIVKISVTNYYWNPDTGTPPEIVIFPGDPPLAQPAMDPSPNVRYIFLFKIVTDSAGLLTEPITSYVDGSIHLNIPPTMKGESGDTSPGGPAVIAAPHHLAP